MDNHTLDNHLTKKNLRKLVLEIKKAGYRNSFMHKDGYIITKKSSLAKVRVFLDEQGNAVVSTIPIGSKEVVFNIIILTIFTFLGGIFLFAALLYSLIGSITFIISLPKSRDYKTVIERIIRLS